MERYGRDTNAGMENVRKKNNFIRYENTYESKRIQICGIFKTKTRLLDRSVASDVNYHTPFTRGSIHEANVFKIHVHDVCSKFASCLDSCLLYHVNVSVSFHIGCRCCHYAVQNYCAVVSDCRPNSSNLQQIIIPPTSFI